MSPNRTPLWNIALGRKPAKRIAARWKYAAASWNGGNSTKTYFRLLNVRKAAQPKSREQHERTLHRLKRRPRLEATRALSRGERRVLGALTVVRRARLGGGDR